MDSQTWFPPHDWVDIVTAPVLPCGDGLACVQAMRVTQEQRGSLKLEAYSHLLQELLVMHLHQISLISSDGLHSSPLMQVSLQTVFALRETMLLSHGLRTS